jgi:hypothetical protein
MPLASDCLQSVINSLSVQWTSFLKAKGKENEQTIYTEDTQIGTEIQMPKFVSYLVTRSKRRQDSINMREDSFETYVGYGTGIAAEFVLQQSKMSSS